MPATATEYCALTPVKPGQTFCVLGLSKFAVSVPDPTHAVKVRAERTRIDCLIMITSTIRFDFVLKLKWWGDVAKLWPNSGFFLSFRF
ncbi:hypothetical protein MWU61_06775 [Loktanella sp. F6476L]|uniref:hypothetical protein n=1 Tax=Loktanella sp. F6476L TaxID=2926405 RepID=UPI001FF1B50B|nr:hypothetical protein [Loktanella sp. F6476L]MCK0120237.1 hypothetical protein [Loktanella sp. F6476L]